MPSKHYARLCSSFAGVHHAGSDCQLPTNPRKPSPFAFMLILPHFLTPLLSSFVPRCSLAPGVPVSLRVKPCIHLPCAPSVYAPTIKEDSHLFPKCHPFVSRVPLPIFPLGVNPTFARMAKESSLVAPLFRVAPRFTNIRTPQRFFNDSL